LMTARSIRKGVYREEANSEQGDKKFLHFLMVH
jgi:hypothetical protein